MSYIEENSNDEDFYNSRTNKRSRKTIEYTLSVFDRFCHSKYQRDSKTIIKDLKDEPNEKIYTLTNQYVIWLGQDHPKILIEIGRYHYERPMKALHPATIRNYVGHLKDYLEEVGGFEISDRRWKKRVKLPKQIEDEPEQIRPEEVRILLDHVSPKKKFLYMVLKDSGMRIGETLRIRKKDVDITKNPIEIKIPAWATKTNKGRTAYITKETVPMMKRRLNEIDENDFVFPSNEDPAQASITEAKAFEYYRNKLASKFSRFGERYESNNRHKITVHSLRSFTATQCAEIIDEDFGHTIIGHSKYLSQYIRNKDKIPSMYLKCEHNLMVYERIEVVDSDERVKKLEMENQSIRKDMLELSEIMEQLSKLKDDKVKHQVEIQILKQKLS